MKSKVFGLMIFGIFLFGMVFSTVSAANTDHMNVTVDILATETSISVPDRIIFGDIAAGYLSDEEGFELTNLGTTDITVTPTLDDSYTGTIFQNLKFDTVKTDPELEEIGAFDVEVLKPTIAGGKRTQQLYAWLDLTDYEDSINDPMEDHEATIVFTATPL